MLRSVQDLESSGVEATDGRIGRLVDLYVDDEIWAIRYLVVNTGDWWLGHQVLIAPPWMADISWIDD